MEQVEEAFQELKWYLTLSSIMVAPEPREPLLIYIAVTANAVSMVLVTECPEPRQHQELKAEEAPGSQHPEPPPPPHTHTRPKTL
jgi:dsDNA-binding SOS-regulon protein